MKQPVQEPVWMDVADALAIHEKMLVLFGGPPGVRDHGLLESALARPRHLFHYGRPTLSEMAGAYAAGIVHNPPFVDGNKRTGFTVAAAFLQVNGRILTAAEEDVVERTLALAAGAIGEEAYSAWLEANSS